MTPQELKNSILQLAIQGKLVEQRPEEGTAEELFAQIQKEKQRLIAEKKIKKEKQLPEITEDEKPFDIPESWVWCRLGSILYKLTDGTHSTPKYTVSGVPFLSVKDMSSGKLNFLNCKYISEQEHRVIYSRCNPEYGDLLLTKVGTTGIPVIVDTNEQFSLFVSVALLKFNQNLIYNKFLQALINSPLVQIQAAENTKGVGNKNWVMRDIASTIIILPPFAEQKRIVAKIEELLPYIDRYEQAWSKLEQFNSRFPEDMKKTLLQYAIQGKLVEQRPEEGTAEELFAQIQEEKQRLIADNKIKKEKPLSEITEDEKPFDIPESWKWVRLVELGSFSSGKTPDMTNRLFWENGTVNWMTSKDMKERFLSESQMKITATAAQEMTVYEAGTLLMVVRSGILKRLLPVCILTQQSTINQDLKAYSLFCNDMSKYIYYMLKALEPNILFNYTKRVTTVDSLKFEEFSRQMLVPLPPLSEQKRIVEKLEQLLPLCEQLK